MNDTGFFVPKQKMNRLAALYCNRTRAICMANLRRQPPGKLPRNKKRSLCRIDGEKPSKSRWFEGGYCKVLSGGGIMGQAMGGLVSTLSDQARFFTMLLNGGILNGHRILQNSTVSEWCFRNILPRPDVMGNRAPATGGTWAGWSVLGEVGLRRTRRTVAIGSDDYEEGEVGMGGAANTLWYVNPVRDMMILWFSQTLDSNAWDGTGTKKKSRANYVVAARSVAPRLPAEAAARRAALAADTMA